MNDGKDDTGVEQLREKMSMSVKDGVPILEIGKAELRFNVLYSGTFDPDISTYKDSSEAEWDADGEAVWWTIYNEFDKAYIEIDPVLVEGDRDE